MIETVVRLAIVGIGSGLATQLSKYFLAQGLSGTLSLTVSTAIAIAFYKLLDWVVLDLPYHSRLLRPYLDPRSRFEGYWLQLKDAKELRPYGWVHIFYNAGTREYVLAGDSVDAEGGIGASWRSTRLYIDLSTDQLLYVYRAEEHQSAKGAVAEGYGVISFRRTQEGTFFRGTGFFVDSQRVRRNFAVDRVTKDLLEDCLGKKTLVRSEDLRKLIVAYHSKYAAQRRLLPEEVQVESGAA